MATADQSTSSSYLDTATFLAKDFSASQYANNLVLQTNNPTDTPLDLSTPLSKALFDVQEVDTHIDTLTTQSALPIINHTQQQSEGAGRVLEAVEEQVSVLQESYKRLEREVGERYEQAEEVRLVSERLARTMRLGRTVQRVVLLGRQMEGQMEEVSSPSSKERGSGHRAMVPAAKTLLELRGVFENEGKEGLGKVQVAKEVQQGLVSPSERSLTSRAQGVVREFSMSSLLQGGGQTFAQAEETKARATSALQALWLLSPAPKKSGDFEPSLLISALQSYLSTALTSSLAALARALATLPTLERTLLEISARCQNIIALESLLDTIKPMPHPLLPAPTSDTNFLQPLLRHLDTSSLPSYFWRSMASQLTTRVQEILSRGGVSARTLRTNKDRVKDAVRECVDRGYRGPASRDKKAQGSWEREAAVMVGSVTGPLGR